jgi:enoyl-CoA hydratase/carnithine racemase
MSDGLRVEVQGAVMVVTINRPDRRNAIDLATAEALAAALDELDARPDLRVGVLTGAGGSFCSGMDLKAFAQTGERPISRSRGGLGIVGCPPATPLIAAVEGFVLGGGFEIALACDLVVAADDTVFGLPEVKRGLVAAGGGALRLPQRLPRAVAMELLLTGEPLPVARAAELGLVNRVCRKDALLAVALDLANSVARCAPLAVTATKRIAVESSAWPVDEAFTRQEEIAAPVRVSKDAAEGSSAFAEKRTPVWTGT